MQQYRIPAQHNSSNNTQQYVEARQAPRHCEDTCRARTTQHDIWVLYCTVWRFAWIRNRQCRQLRRLRRRVLIPSVFTSPRPLLSASCMRSSAVATACSTITLLQSRQISLPSERRQPSRRHQCSEQRYYCGGGGSWRSVYIAGRTWYSCMQKSAGRLGATAHRLAGPAGQRAEGCDQRRVVQRWPVGWGVRSADSDLGTRTTNSSSSQHCSSISCPRRATLLL